MANNYTKLNKNGENRARNLYVPVQRPGYNMVSMLDEKIFKNCRWKLIAGAFGFSCTKLTKDTTRHENER